METKEQYLLEAKNLSKYFPVKNFFGKLVQEDKCKEDALKEASESKELYQTAEENLQSAIEALLSPILKNAGYTMQWDI